VRIPLEFRLVAACCRWPPSPSRDAAVREAAAAAIDWEEVLAVVRRHRVDGLVHDGLMRAGVEPPADVAGRLQASAQGIAVANLRYAAETARLSKALAAAGLDHIFLKGLTLNVLAYGTLAVKRSSDIDIAFDPSVYPHALRVMEELGYVGFHEGVISPKHTIWVRQGVSVEIHNSLVDSAMMLPGIGVRSARQTVEVGPGVAVETLAREELFAYLCVHGAGHAWARLKWLADVAALIKHDAPDEIDRLHARSIELGGGRSTGQALLLCADLFGQTLSPRLEAALRSDRAMRYLAGAALKSMLRGIDHGTATIHFTHFRLMRGWRYKASELKRKFSAGADAEHGFSSLIQPVLAAPKWLIRRVGLR
jgi:hypothetical protein